MKIYFITYSNDNFEKSRKRIIQEAYEFGKFNVIIEYEPSKLSSYFTEDFHEILKMPRGGGYWIWKFDIILQTLNMMDENDILVYLDAGCTINKNGSKRFDEYINMLNKSDKDFLGFRLYYPEYVGTIQEIFDIFNVTEEIKNSIQILAGIQLMKNNINVRNMIKDCIGILSKNKDIITDKYDKQQKHPKFQFNRHDQSIFSVAKKMKNNVLILNDETCHLSLTSNKPFLATRKKI